MPNITGDLRLVTAKAATITHVWIHAPTVRTVGTRVIVTDTDTIPVTNGQFRVEIEIGEAVLVPLHSGVLGTPVPIVVNAATSTLAEAVRNAHDLTPSERDRVAELYQQAATAVNEAAAAADTAKKSANAAAGALASKANVNHTHTSAAITDRVLEPMPGSANSGKVWALGTDGMPSIGSDPTSTRHAVRKGYVDNRFAPKNHNHGIGEITGLTAALDSKASTRHLHTLADISNVPNAHSSQNVFNTLVSRDGTGRAQISTPAQSNDIANKSYVDTAIAAAGAVAKTTTLAGQVSVYKIGRLVFMNVRGGTAGKKGTLAEEFRPIQAVDFFLTAPNKRAYPGWCNVLTNGTVEISFSDSGSTNGYGCITYLSAS